MDITPRYSRSYKSGSIKSERCLPQMPVRSRHVNLGQDESRFDRDPCTERARSTHAGNRIREQGATCENTTARVAGRERAASHMLLVCSQAPIGSGHSFIHSFGQIRSITLVIIHRCKLTHDVPPRSFQNYTCSQSIENLRYNRLQKMVQNVIVQLMQYVLSSS